MTNTWQELDPYRGKFFDGEWPTITQMFDITLSRFPDRPCFTVYEPDRISFTYREVKDLIVKIGSKMIEDGVSKGDRILLNGKNSIQWGLGYLATNYCGAVVVPVDNQMHVDRCQKLSSFAGCSYILADEDVIKKLDKEDEWFKNLKGMMTLKGEIEGFSNIIGANPKALHDNVKISDDDLAALLFTSGTTGNEKAAMLTNKNIVSDTYLVADGMGCSEVDTLYALLPLHHSYCCTTVLLETIKHGAECLFGHGIIISRMLNDLKKGHVTIFMGIPLLYNKLLAGIEKGMEKKGKFVYSILHVMMSINGFTKQHFNFTPFRGFFRKNILSQLGLDHNNLLICGAGPLAPEVFKKYNQLGLDFVQGYGLTECAPVVTLNPKEHFKTASIGKALKGMDVIIAEPNEQGVGEIRVKGPNVTPGYYLDKEHTDELFDENGYLKTGDLGSIDKEGYFFIRGRAKNLIVTEGGKNVYPEEIEDAFQTNPAIEQIMVRGYMAKKDVPAEQIEAVIFPSTDYYKGKSAKEIEEDIEKEVKKVNLTLLAYKRIDKITILEERMQETTTRKIKRNTVAN
ncbi:MAG: AMP-binding protein [Sphaerochaetaceae bacterium]|nr:AMP-binding protein [Sphaerochaetaceae bacterium]